MFLPKIIFFDIDDTLYLKDERRIIPSTRIALKMLKEKGIMIAIATGRSMAVFPKEIIELIDEIGIEMIVSINGQYVQFKGKKLIDFAMDRHNLKIIASALDKKHINYAWVSQKRLAAVRQDDFLDAATKTLGLTYEVDPYFYQREEVYQMLAFYESSQDEVVEQILPSSFKVVRWHDFGVDILDKDGSKARGIGAALKALNLTVNDAMAFGDGLNDMEMLQTVGFGVAMGNAVNELKAVVNYVCAPIEKDGIYRALIDLQILDEK